MIRRNESLARVLVARPLRIGRLLCAQPFCVRKTRAHFGEGGQSEAGGPARGEAQARRLGLAQAGDLAPRRGGTGTQHSARNSFFRSARFARGNAARTSPEPVEREAASARPPRAADARFVRGRSRRRAQLQRRRPELNVLLVWANAKARNARSLACSLLTSPSLFFSRSLPRWPRVGARGSLAKEALASGGGHKLLKLANLVAGNLCLRLSVSAGDSPQATPLELHDDGRATLPNLGGPLALERREEARGSAFTRKTLTGRGASVSLVVRPLVLGARLARAPSLPPGVTMLAPALFCPALASLPLLALPLPGRDRFARSRFCRLPSWRFCKLQLAKLERASPPPLPAAARASSQPGESQVVRSIVIGAAAACKLKVASCERAQLLS